MFLLATDFDRTFYTNNIDLKRNIDNLPKFRERNKFVIITGRSYGDFINLTKNSIKTDYLIVNHGATILKDDEIIKSIYISESTKKKIMELFDFNKITYFASHDKDSRVDINTLDLSKINIQLSDNLVAKKAADYINENFSDIEAYISMRHKNHIEIVNKKANKANAIRYVSNLEKINKHLIYTVGDGYTDIEMIKQFNGYAISDAVDELKEYAIDTISSVSDMMEYLNVDVNLEDTDLEITDFVNECYDKDDYFKKYMGKVYNKKEGKHLTIRKNSELIACALLLSNNIYIDNDVLDILTIGSICVDKKYRKQGYFKMLMGLIKKYEEKYDIGVLSGNIEKYKKYDYYPNILNLYKFGSLDNNITFKKMDDTYLDEILEMYNSKIHLNRNKNNFLDIANQWKTDAYYIFNNNIFDGYLFYNTKRDFINEIRCSDINSTASSFAKLKNRDYINLKVFKSDYETIKKLDGISNSKMYNRQLYSIHNFKKVISVYLNYKNKYSDLKKGELSIKIDDEIIKISVLDRVDVTDNNTYDMELTKEQAMNILLNKKMSLNELLSSWFYLDIDIYNNDLV